MVIVLVLAQMFRKVRYAPREHRYLHLRRPRVAFVRAVLLYNLRFLFSHSQLLVSPLHLLLYCLTNSTPYATTCNGSYRRLYEPPIPGIRRGFVDDDAHGRLAIPGLFGFG